MQYAIAATAEALKDSGWLPKNDYEQAVTVGIAAEITYELTQLTKSRAYA